MKTVFLTSFFSVAEAHLVRGKLLNEGIEVLLSNENFTSLYPNMAGMGGGVNLFVTEEDLERALEILND